MIILNGEYRTPLYEQIYTYYKSMILEGHLKPGFLLPSIRELSASLCVGKNTVIMAYDRLMAEGYVASKQRVGFVVENIGADALRGTDIPQIQELCHIEERQEWPQMASQMTDANSFEVDFKYGAFDSQMFPLEAWRKITNDILLSSDSAEKLSAYGDPQGELPLREEICDYLHESRGVNCVPDQIVIDSASQTAIMKLLLLFDKDKHSVVVDDPVFDGLSEAAKSLGYEVQAIPIARVAYGAEYLTAIEKVSPKLVFVIPSHQFPTGAIMPLTTRIQLLAWAEKNDAYILEDDYDSEYRYHSRPIPSLQSIDRWQRVVYMGTFSKSLSPALRLSYLVLPPKLLARYNRQLGSLYCSVPWFGQEIITRFMKQGLWGRHLRRVVAATKRKHDLLVSGIERQLGSNFDIYGQNGGVHLWLRSKKGIKQEELIERAAKEGVRVYADSQYWATQNSDRHTVLLGYHALSEMQIERGIELLARAWS